MRLFAVGERLQPPRNKWSEMALLLSTSEVETFSELVDSAAKSDNLDHAQSSLVSRLQRLLVEKLG